MRMVDDVEDYYRDLSHLNQSCQNYFLKKQRLIIDFSKIEFLC